MSPWVATADTLVVFSKSTWSHCSMSRSSAHQAPNESELLILWERNLCEYRPLFSFNRYVVQSFQFTGKTGKGGRTKGKHIRVWLLFSIGKGCALDLHMKISMSVKNTCTWNILQQDSLWNWSETAWTFPLPNEKDHKSNSFYFNFSVLFRAKEIHDGESIAIVPSFIVLFSLKRNASFGRCATGNR